MIEGARSGPDVVRELSAACTMLRTVQRELLREHLRRAGKSGEWRRVSDELIELYRKGRS